MNKKFLLTKERKSFIAFLCTFLVLVSLGCWQLYRLSEKNDYLESIFLNLRGSARNVAENYKPKLYDKVRVNGVMKYVDAVWLYRRHPSAKNQDGAYLAVPVLAQNDKLYMALIGWFLNDHKEEVLKEIALNNKIEFDGIFLDSESNSRFIPKNDYKNNIIFTMNMPEISSAFNRNMGSYFIAAINAKAQFQTSMIPITSNMMVKVNNNHFMYAATWFGLAAILCYIYYSYIVFNVTKVQKPPLTKKKI
jgi:surfeit locus 1 family protein